MFGKISFCNVFLKKISPRIAILSFLNDQPSLDKRSHSPPQMPPPGRNVEDSLSGRLASQGRLNESHTVIKERELDGHC